MRSLLVAMALVALLPGVASAQFEVVINNGLTPSNPANLIDSWSNWFTTHFVRNVGCPPGWPAVYAGQECPPAWGPTTEVAIVSGGRVMQVHVTETSSVILDGGWVDSLYAENSAVATMEAGSLDYLIANDTARVTLNGGALEYLWGFDDGSVAMTGGTSEYVLVRDNATGTLTGGTVQYVTTDGNANLMLRDVTVGFLIARGSSQVTVTGGEIAYSEAFDDAVITVVGAAFAVDGVPVAYGDLAAQTGILTGQLASGEALVHSFRQGELPGGEFTGTLSLAGIPSAPVPAVARFGRGVLVVGVIFVIALRRPRRR